MKKTTKPMLAQGVSSLLLIFVSLCLITFAVLSFSSAQADFKLSSKMASHTKEYYNACNKANEKLGEIDRILADTFHQAHTETEYFSSLEKALDGYFSEDHTVHFQISIDQDQLLSVVLEISYPSFADDTFYTVRQWKTVNTADWTPDTRQKVYIQPTS